MWYLNIACAIGGLIMHEQALIAGLLNLITATSGQMHVVSVNKTTNILGVPLGTGDWVDVKDVHGIDLFERATLGLDHEEVDDEEHDHTGNGEDETVQPGDLVGDESGEERDKEVHQPVGGGRESHAGSTVTSWVELSDDGPNHRSPGSGEGNNEETGEDDHDTTSGLVILWVLEATNEGIDQQAHSHPGGTSKKGLAATTVLNDPETTNGSNDVDGTKNDGGDVRVLETSGRENGGTVVEEEVGTSKLLTSLEGHTEKSAVEHTRTSEDLVPWVVTSSLLGSELLLDLGDFSVDQVGVRGDTVKAGHVDASLLNSADTVCVTWRLWNEEDRATEEDGPKSGEAVWNSPLGAVVVGTLGTVVNHVGGPDTKSDEQLVGGNDGTTNSTWNRLRLVHWDGNRESTDSNTSDQTTHGKLNPSGAAGDLNDNTDNVEEGRCGNGVTATNVVGKRSGNQATDQGTNAEETDNGTGSSSTEGEGTVRMRLAEALQEIGHFHET
jgi:hypothetical protein